MEIQVGDRITVTWDGSEHEGPYFTTITVTALDETRMEISGEQ